MVQGRRGRLIFRCCDSVRAGALAPARVALSVAASAVRVVCAGGVRGRVPGLGQVEALATARVIDEPGGARLDEALPRLEAGRVLGQGGGHGLGQDRVREERTGAPRVVVLRIQDHALAATQLQDGRAHQGRVGALPGLNTEAARQLGIHDGGAQGRAHEAEVHGEHHPATGGPPGAVAQAGLADAALDRRGSVRKAEVRGQQAHDDARQSVVGLDALDGLGHLVAVGTHVLHRGGADGAGNAGERLDTGQARRQRPGDELVPDRARAGAHDDRSGGVLVDDGGDLVERLYVDDRALEGGVRRQQVRPAADDEEQASGGVGRGDGIHQSVSRRNAHVLSDGPAHAQGRQISKGRHALSLAVQRPPGPPSRIHEAGRTSRSLPEAGASPV